jgi:hypothetical protein
MRRAEGGAKIVGVFHIFHVQLLLPYKREFFNTLHGCLFQYGNQNPHIEEGQTTQWQNEKVQKDKQ